MTLSLKDCPTTGPPSSVPSLLHYLFISEVFQKLSGIYKEELQL